MCSAGLWHDTLRQLHTSGQGGCGDREVREVLGHWQVRPLKHLQRGGREGGREGRRREGGIPSLSPYISLSLYLPLSLCLSLSLFFLYIYTYISFSISLYVFFCFFISLSLYVSISLSLSLSLYLALSLSFSLSRLCGKECLKTLRNQEPCMKPLNLYKIQWSVRG